MIAKPTYQAIEQERDELRVIIANLHKCLSAATVSLRNAGLYPYPGRDDGRGDKDIAASTAWQRWIQQPSPIASPKEEKMPKLNVIHQRQLEEDERRDRTEYLPNDLDAKGWHKYMVKQVYLAMLRWGGDWDRDLTHIFKERTQ